jgi:hypothetical protein
MPEQFENPKTEKIEDETAGEGSADNKVERVAEKLAKQGAKTEHKYDEEKSIFTN